MVVGWGERSEPHQHGFAPPDASQNRAGKGGEQQDEFRSTEPILNLSGEKSLQVWTSPIIMILAVWIKCVICESFVNAGASASHHYFRKSFDISVAIWFDIYNNWREVASRGKAGAARSTVQGDLKRCRRFTPVGSDCSRFQGCSASGRRTSDLIQKRLRSEPGDAWFLIPWKNENSCRSVP